MFRALEIFLYSFVDMHNNILKLNQDSHCNWVNIYAITFLYDKFLFYWC